MDANEVFARQRMSEAMARCATGAPTTPEEMEIVRQARLERERFNPLVEEDEVLERTGTRNLDELEAVQPFLQALGFPGIHRTVKLGSRLLGTSDVPTVRAIRFDVDRWFENFETVATQLGYEKRQAASRGRGVGLAVVALAALLFG